MQTGGVSARGFAFAATRWQKYRVTNSKIIFRIAPSVTVGNSIPFETAYVPYMWWNGQFRWATTFSDAIQMPNAKRREWEHTLEKRNKSVSLSQSTQFGKRFAYPYVVPVVTPAHTVRGYGTTSFTQEDAATYSYYFHKKDVDAPHRVYVTMYFKGYWFDRTHYVDGEGGGTTEDDDEYDPDLYGEPGGVIDEDMPIELDEHGADPEADP